MKSGELPLLTSTPDGWAEDVLRDPVALLNDHAHLEKKAALNALELLHRWPEGTDRDDWAAALTTVAKDETAHLHQVVRLLHKRGGALTRGHKNLYAADLHGHIRKGRGTEEVLDRLLVSALIEARSCERFDALQGAARDRELSALYRGLWSSEKGHFTVFLGLARAAAPAAARKRWEEFLEIEARVLAAQPPGPRMHGGF